MSFDSEQGSARQPRSLTLTFAETHPWERLVRDRLNGLPRGYLKRFVLLLIEKADLDLSSDDAFCQQVEQALLQRELPQRELQVRPVMNKSAVADPLRDEVPLRDILPAAARGAASRVPETPPPAQRRPEPAPPSTTSTPHRGSDPGFGALEL